MNRRERQRAARFNHTMSIALDDCKRHRHTMFRVTAWAHNIPYQLGLWKCRYCQMDMIVDTRPVPSNRDGTARYFDCTGGHNATT
jgi:hypothetical protein